MGSWRRMGAFLGLVPDENHRDADYGYAEDDYPANADQGYGGFDRAPRDERRLAPVEYNAPDYSPGYSGAPTHGALAMQLQEDSRRVTESATASRPQTVKLTGFGEARIIGERYRDGSSVILDMTDLSDADARRVVDFAAGLAFAMRGSIDKVTTRVFMLLPPHVDVSAEDRRAYAGHYGAR